MINEDPTYVRVNSRLLVLLCFSLFYLGVNFMFTPNNFFPVHQDDYILLGRGFSDLALFIERPITLNMVYLAAAGGIFAPYALVSVLVVIYPLLVIIFTERLIGARLNWPLYALFAAITFAHFSAFENGTYLGSVVGISGVLGTLTLILMHMGFTGAGKKYIYCSLVAYFMTCFAREDFLLPPFILLLYFYIKTIQIPRDRRQIEHPIVNVREIYFYGGIMLIVALFSILFSIKVGSRFENLFFARSDVIDPYAVKLSFISLVGSFELLSFEYIKYPTILAILGVATIFAINSGTRLELLAFIFIVISIMMPYAMIPNNLPSYRVVSWLPWFVVVGCIALQRLDLKLQAYIDPRFRFIGTIVILAAGYLAVQEYDSDRQIIAGWYVNQREINKNIYDTLDQNRDQIKFEKIVAIRGVEKLSPWSNTDAQFLKNKMGFQNMWLVLVPGSSAFNTINYLGSVNDFLISDKRRNVLVARFAALCEYSNILVIDFDQRGVGKLSRITRNCQTK